MNKRNNLLRIGYIIGIVAASILLFTGFIFIGFGALIGDDKQLAAQLGGSGITQAEIDILAMIYVVLGLTFLVQGVLGLIFYIISLVKMKTGNDLVKNNQGWVIAVTIISFFVSTPTFILSIVALCLKDNQPAQE